MNLDHFADHVKIYKYESVDQWEKYIFDLQFNNVVNNVKCKLPRGWRFFKNHQQPLLELSINLSLTVQHWSFAFTQTKSGSTLHSLVQRLQDGIYYRDIIKDYMTPVSWGGDKDKDRGRKQEEESHFPWEPSR